MTFHRDRPTDGDAYLDEWIKTALEAELAQMDAAFDFPAGLHDVYARAGLHDVYARAGLVRSVAVESSSDLMPGTAGHSAVQAVVEHIEMLDALLGAVTTSDKDTSPQQGVMYLTMARQFLLQLRIGLSARRLSQARAIQLVDTIAHNLTETDRILRAQQGMSLHEAVHARIGELREVGGDLNHQLQGLREKVLRLFTGVEEPAPPSPVLTR
jgi:hypothetical protein